MRTVPCPTCSGAWYAPSGDAFDKPDRCLDCHEGQVPSPEAVEAGSRKLAYWIGTTPDRARQIMRDVLSAAMKVGSEAPRPEDQRSSRA